MNPRHSASFIASTASHVKINLAGVKKIASEISRAIEIGEFKPGNMMIHTYPLPQNEDPSSVEWLFVADTLNYSFWEMEDDKHYTIDLHGIKYTGYMALCAALSKALEGGFPITSSQFYSEISAEDVKKIFTSSSGKPIPLEEERLKSLRESGKILNEKFNGSFSNVVLKANKSARNLLQLIVNNFPSFRDEAVYAGKLVSFYKRAQILVADIWGLFRGKGLGQFDDIDTLTMFADYRVPQSLVHFGAMEYSLHLHELLANNYLFKNGSLEEIEIRGCSIHVVELVKKELAHHPPFKFEDESFPINSAMIDFFLWEYRRRFSEELRSIPYHKVRCIYY